jgi:hypothetical protein
MQNFGQVRTCPKMSVRIQTKGRREEDGSQGADKAALKSGTKPKAAAMGEVPH